MDIKVIFKTISNRDAFAKRWNLNAIEDEENHLIVPWHLVNHAIKDETTDDLIQLDSTTEHDFIVRGDKTKIEELANIVTELGDDWFVVTSANGVALGEVAESIELTDSPIEFLSNVISINSTDEKVPTEADPKSNENQWHRLRVISRYRPLLPNYTLYELSYVSKPEIYIVDSGINFDHDEFDYEGLEKVDFYTLPVFNGNYSDDIGHGTAVASMAVGKNLGIAQHARLMNVKVGGIVDGVRRTASLLELGQALDSILDEAIQNPLTSRIVNMSWGTVRSAWLDAKVANLLNAGVTVVAAAGNGGISVDDVSPAGIPEIITVGAIDKYDIPAGFNNISPSDSGLTTSDGLSLDLFAPGDNILVADSSGNSKYMYASGTSLAAPLVAGVAAEIASLNESAVLEPVLKNKVIETATEDALLFEDDRFLENQNRLIYMATGDDLDQYKITDAVSYLGTHEDDSPIIGDLNSSLSVGKVQSLLPEDPIEYSIKIQPDSLEYESFISVDSSTGVFTVEKPDVAFAEDVKLKMVTFIGIAQNSKVKMETNPIFFFDVNPEYKDSAESDITLALTEINSIGFFDAWGFFIK